MLAFALMGQNFLSLSVFLFSMNWSAPWPHGARENPGMLSPVQGFKQQEGAFLMTLDNIHSFPGFCNPLFIFPLMAPVLTFYPGLLVILSQAPLFLLVAESPTGSTSHHRMWCDRELGLEVKLWHSCLARRHQVTGLTHGLGTDFPDGSWLWLTFPESLFLTLSYLPDSIKSPTVTLSNPSTIICLGKNNFVWGAIFHSSSSYCCLTGSHLLLFCSKMSPACGTGVPICLPSSHTLLFCLTLKWQLCRHYSILYLFIFLHSKMQKYKYTHTHIYMYIGWKWASDEGIERRSLGQTPMV